MEAVHLLEPGTTTKTIASLKQQHIEATVFEITGRRNPGETTTDTTKSTERDMNQGRGEGTTPIDG
ncbi:MAG: hypothetical protein CM15mP39_11840 [Synechococcus sp.]|nr:MAG: hypothetical protein CM15mP39_11840 [Synechococcus sp.]